MLEPTSVNVIALAVEYWSYRTIDHDRGHYHFGKVRKGQGTSVASGEKRWMAWDRWIHCHRPLGRVSDMMDSFGENLYQRSLSYTDDELDSGIFIPPTPKLTMQSWSPLTRWRTRSMVRSYCTRYLADRRFATLTNWIQRLITFHCTLSFFQNLSIRLDTRALCASPRSTFCHDLQAHQPSQHLYHLTSLDPNPNRWKTTSTRL